MASNSAKAILARLGIAADYAEAKLVKRQVLTGTYRWRRPSDAPGAMVTELAYQGDVIEITEAEAKRGEGLGALAKPGTAAAAPAEDTGTLDDDALAALNVDKTLEYVTLHPEDRERVLTLEAAREKGARVGVVDGLARPTAEEQAAAGADAGAGS